ncbi:hypothetical protein CSUI_002400 [Cystoisospora suis]|uniref:Uncharacterized protein n=1 Tax=Cystoisospora suis TaxID=483139 RepID=A0A2C6L9H5_9APIC|nr:hypothetical protein CSUI_002400 [Cystoisospora suis]
MNALNPFCSGHLADCVVIHSRTNPGGTVRRANVSVRNRTRMGAGHREAHQAKVGENIYERAGRQLADWLAALRSAWLDHILASILPKCDSAGSVELFPDGSSRLPLLRVDVLDYSLWNPYGHGVHWKTFSVAPR